MSTAQLEEGMVVDRDVKMNEIMLVRANTPLTAAHIRSLRRWNVTRVSIEAPPDMQQEEQPDEAIEHDRIFSDQDYIREKTRIENLFRNMGNDKQMLLIKQCVLNHLEDRFRGE
jgi:hypothetical protein